MTTQRAPHQGRESNHRLHPTSLQASLVPQDRMFTFPGFEEPPYSYNRTVQFVLHKAGNCIWILLQYNSWTEHVALELKVKLLLIMMLLFFKVYLPLHAGLPNSCLNIRLTLVNTVMPMAIQTYIESHLSLTTWFETLSCFLGRRQLACIFGWHWSTQ